MHITSRRSFLKLAGLAGGGMVAGLSGIIPRLSGDKRIIILHTNDTHSRIDPYPDNDPNFAGMGGYARRAALVNKLRLEDPELLLLDAGDIFQGTPYYNWYGGEIELKLMSRMGYDAATIGNHEFDSGLEALLKVMPNATFPFVCSNLDFSDTILKGATIPRLVLKRHGVRIGIYGLGIDPRGLVSPVNFGETRYLDPVEVAREMEEQLRAKDRCDLIICLSHLGYSYNYNKASDVVIARNTRHTDIIIGGHTHTLLDPPAVEMNMDNKPVHIGQTGSGGVRLGIMNVYFNSNSKEKIVQAYTTKLFKKQVT